ncbi:NADH-quinone oxidoreductase subunit G [Enemella evansiae]|uniref:NADH-quinone oxidoreductase subunit G n=1 Tax=Enemella evansiae TaxID=2016499 RepID=UPI000B95E0F8|nr:NADH-quinone oxidoreductase subunit G [Enemella evansiae]OYN94070.1 NADH-quinone oxidoreductase subunit G [Enemella evansiae]OYN95355.1 NADH-quinone oxidoreductase subunit G [Enemella evansiae]OYO03458.1 NADH-quinone oxidoreductase subunit G [Enemella evansiae]PFG68638.1 NADH dehydrogenase subunit G [Propionibacteriaceae bacterium ES.041]
MTVTDKPSDQGSDVAKREDLLTVTIDDVEVSVPKGTLLIRAAEMIGVAIPRFCDHPLLDPVGACRQCLVEIPDAGNGRGMPKPQASCTIEVADGMKVKTQLTSRVAEKAQEGMLEFLLVNHPLDCPICDKGGECPLQNQAMSNGHGESRFEGVKRTFPKPIAISAEILLDRERCVLCARCTRFSEQIAGDPFIALTERGALQQVGIYEKEPFESYFSGNTIQICPVGALTSTAYRFRSRPFDLVSTPSTCENCAAGCGIRVDHRRGEVMRRLAGDEPEVNEEWNCDKGRFGFVSGRQGDRITTPLVRDGDVLRPASWAQAIDAAVAGILAAVDANDGTPGANLGVLPGGRLTLEDSYGYAKFARAVLGTNNIDFRSRPHTLEEGQFLAHAIAGTGLQTTYADLENANRVLLVDFEPEDESPIVFLRLRKAVRKKKLDVITVGAMLSYGSSKLKASLVPALPGTEAQVLDNLPADIELDENSVVMVGERACQSLGTLTAALQLVQRTGAKLAWVPRRAGDRGAIEAGCLPNLLPGGRLVTDPAARVDAQTVWGIEGLPAEPGLDADAILAAGTQGNLDALIVGGVEPADFRFPHAALAGLESAGFVVSLETRRSEVTERADVVFPVSLIEERHGTFLDWEGRERPVTQYLGSQQVMSDLRVLAALADALGADLGVRTPTEAKAELAEFAGWEGQRAAAPDEAPEALLEPGTGEAVLASWRELIDDSRAIDGEADLQATARPPVVRMNPTMAGGITDGTLVRVSREGGEIVLPLLVDPGVIDRVVWLPTNAPGVGIGPNLGAVPGDLVRVELADGALADNQEGVEA